MKTSAQWWQETKSDPAKLANWLRRQYHGEMEASLRIAAMSLEAPNKHSFTLQVIASQEARHAAMIFTLLDSRLLSVGNHDPEARYWAEVKSAAIDHESKAAIATLAEGMRLERIRVIASDEDAPADIRAVFCKILVDEEWHEQAFAKMTTPEKVEELKPYHNLGREVLGLVN